MVVVEEMDRAGTAVTGMLLADLAVGMARAVKGRVEALGTMEDRKVDLDQETMEDHKEAMEAQTGTLDQEITEARTRTLDREAMENRTATQVQATMEDRTATPDQEAMEDRAATPDKEATEALTMVLANRTQAVSHKSTCTRRS